MPRMKADELEFDIKELDEAEYTEGEFEDYDGPEPPKRTRLSGRIKKMWLSETRPETGSKAMLVVLFVAEGNTGDKEQYNGCPIWERLPLIASAKFRWQPFLDATGLNLRQIKNKMFIAENDDNVGAPIEKIDKWVVGSEDALVDVVTDRERYEGEWQTKVGKFLELSEDYDPDAAADADDEDEELDDEDEELDDEDLDEDEDAEEDDEDEDEDEDEEADDEDDEDEPEPPARGRRAATRPAASAAKGKAAPARTTRTAKPATTRAAKAEPAKAATTRGTRTAATRTTAKAKTATSTRRGGRKSTNEIDDEPPF